MGATNATDTPDAEKSHVFWPHSVHILETFKKICCLEERKWYWYNHVGEKSHLENLPRQMAVWTIRPSLSKLVPAAPKSITCIDFIKRVHLRRKPWMMKPLRVVLIWEICCYYNGKWWIFSQVKLPQEYLHQIRMVQTWEREQGRRQEHQMIRSRPWDAKYTHQLNRLMLQAAVAKSTTETQK